MRNHISKVINLAKFIYLQRVRGFSPPGNEPFMATTDVARFKNEIAKAEHYVEFGSGGSTVYADRNGISTISVENDPYYARVVAEQLSGDSVRQIVCKMGVTGEWGFPIFPDATKARSYITAPWNDNLFPQFILVDGRYRVACALESARRANLAGASAVLMFDDYVDRPFYKTVEEFLGAPELGERSAIFCIGSQIVDAALVDHWLKDAR